MTVCLAECRCYSNSVAVNLPAKSQAAASDSSAFPKAAPPGASRASGISKFFEKIKPLSDLVGAILDAAGRRIGKLFDFDNLVEFKNLIDFDDFIDWGVSAPGQEKGGGKSVEQYSAPVESHSASKIENAVLIPVMIKPSVQRVKSHSPSDDAKAASSSEVRNSQSIDLQEGWEGTFFDGPSDDDVNDFGERLTFSLPATEEIPGWIYR